MSHDGNTVKGKGAQLNLANPFLKDEYGEFEFSGLDEESGIQRKIQLFEEHPRKIVNKINSPDLGFIYGMNPYQGCEHGCVYCYARNSHHYWGFSAGLDFETKIIVKKNAPEILEKQLKSKNWKVSPIMLSGNTDCYQPIERKLGITREMLKGLLKFRHPVSIITKNNVILRDIDILTDLAALNLVSVSVSINSLNEKVRSKLEPRTATYRKRFEVIEKLSAANIPVSIMVAPVIPGLTSQEIPDLLKMASECGANSASYILVRLNGTVGAVFTDWVQKAFPDASKKILNQIAECHGGKMNDSRFGTRMRGDGKVAESIRNLFILYSKKYFRDSGMKVLDTSRFVQGSVQLSLF